MRWTMMLSVLVFTIGCTDQQALQRAEQRASTAEKRVAELEVQLKALTNENAKLKETDQAYFAEAAELVAKGALQEGADKFSAIPDKFPTSALAADARQRASAALTALASQKAAAEKAVSGLTTMLERQPDATSAMKVLDDLEKKYPFENVATAVAEARTELSAQAEKEREAAQGLTDLGIEISNIRTYWTLDHNVMGGKELVVPYVRFDVKNVGDQPLTRLVASAAFELTKNKELLGDGSTYVIGSGDPPLKPGYKKEVFFGSGTGYSGYGIIMSRPPTSADLYVETDRGQKRLVRTLKISPRLEGF